MTISDEANPVRLNGLQPIATTDPARTPSLLVGILLAAPASAAPGDKIDMLRDLAGRVGPVLGSA